MNRHEIVSNVDQHLTTAQTSQKLAWILCDRIFCSRQTWSLKFFLNFLFGPCGTTKKRYVSINSIISSLGPGG